MVLRVCCIGARTVGTSVGWGSWGCLGGTAGSGVNVGYGGSWSCLGRMASLGTGWEVLKHVMPGLPWWDHWGWGGCGLWCPGVCHASATLTGCLDPSQAGDSWICCVRAALVGWLELGCVCWRFWGTPHRGCFGRIAGAKACYGCGGPGACCTRTNLVGWPDWAQPGGSWNSLCQGHLWELLLDRGPWYTGAALEGQLDCLNCALTHAIKGKACVYVENGTCWHP